MRFGARLNTVENVCVKFHRCAMQIVEKNRLLWLCEAHSKQTSYYCELSIIFVAA